MAEYIDIFQIKPRSFKFVVFRSTYNGDLVNSLFSKKTKYLDLSLLGSVDVKNSTAVLSKSKLERESFDVSNFNTENISVKDFWFGIDLAGGKELKETGNTNADLDDAYLYKDGTGRYAFFRKLAILDHLDGCRIILGRDPFFQNPIEIRIENKTRKISFEFTTPHNAKFVPEFIESTAATIKEIVINCKSAQGISKLLVHNYTCTTLHLAGGPFTLKACKFNVLYANGIKGDDVLFENSSLVYSEKETKHATRDGALRASAFATLKMLIGNNSAESFARDSLRFYAHIDSKRNRFASAHFWFNGRFEKLLRPFLFMFGTGFIFVCFFDIVHVTSEYSSIHNLFVPTDFLKSVLFKDFQIDPCNLQNVSTPKVFLGLLASFFYYCVFCFTMGIKNRFGYRKI